VLSGPLVSVVCHGVLLTCTSARTPAAATGPHYRRSPLSAARAESLAPRRPLLSCGNGTARASRPGTSAGRPSYPPLCLGPLLSSLFSPPHDVEPRTPLPLFPLYRTSEPPQKASATVPLPFHPAPLHPRSSTPPPPPSFPKLAHRPRTPGPSLLSLISPETSSPSAFTGEPLAAPLLALLGPHLTFLHLSPWCRTRAASLVTTVPAPPPPNATAQRRPTAPPTRHYWGEPRLRSPCPAHPPLSRGALA
jgi:hypothetical protein